MSSMKWSGLAAALLLGAGPAQARPGVINYSPWHLPGQDGASGRMPPGAAQIDGDLLELWKYADELRTYSVDAVGQAVIAACQREGMRINVGSFLVREQIGTDPSLVGQTLDVAQNQAINRQVIDSLIAVANLGYDVVQSLIVGNELILWDNMPIARLHEYIGQVRAATGGRYPLTTGETWNVGYQAHPDLAAGLDFILFHGHPYWEGAGIDVAISQSNAHAWQVMRALFPGQRLVQGETGWPTAGGAYDNATYAYAGVAVPSVANQARFITDLRAQVRASLQLGQPMEVWLFEAFDEPWKGAEGTVGGSWGFLDGAGVPKHDAVPARLVPLGATESAPGTVLVTLDGVATGAAVALLTDPASWEITGGTITTVSLAADGKTLTIRYSGGDAFKGLRAAEAACDVIARRRFVLGDPGMHPVPGGQATGAGGSGGQGGAGGSSGGAGGGGGATGSADAATARDGAAGAPAASGGSSRAGCSCAVAHARAGARPAGLLAALALLALRRPRARARARAQRLHAPP